MTAAELTQYFSIAEWVKLCAWVDREHGKPTPGYQLLGSGWNDNIMPVAARRGEAGFYVHSVTKTETVFVIRVLLTKSKKWVDLNCAEIRDVARKVAA